MQKEVSKLFSRNKYILFLLLAGTLSWSITMFKSGILYSYGIGFWGPNGHDGVWHLALINSLSRGSFTMPIFAGKIITNYHIGYDLLLAIIHKITFIPASVLYFQITPPLIAASVGFLTYKFVYIWKMSRTKAFWSTFFVYFGGNLGWVITLIRSGELSGESVFWSQQPASTLINPPFALSLVLILFGLTLLVSSKKLTTRSTVLLAVIFGLLIEVKAYAAVVVLGALFITGIYIFWKKRNSKYLKIWFLSSIISAIIFLPFNLQAGSLLELKPFWFLETMMSFSDRLGWLKFGEAMVNYKTGGVLIKGFAAYILALLIFWYGNVGTRMVQELYFVKLIKNKVWPSNIDIFLTSAMLIGCLMTLLFVQKGTAWNTIQFFYYTLFFASILAGIVFGGILETKKNMKLRIYLVAGMLFFTLPTTIATLKHYLPTRPPSKISTTELSALNFLKSQPQGVVLTLPFNKDKADEAIENPPRPLYLYESTAYVSSYTNKLAFFEDQVNLDITQYDWKTRRSQVEDYFNQTDNNRANAFLSQNDIQYVYIAKPLYSKQPLGSLENIYENEEVVIYRTRL